jgi:glutamate 5-kinase
MAPVSRPSIAVAQRIVVKVGTRVLTDTDTGCANDRLEAIVRTLARAHRAGTQIIIVSSGAVGLGCVQLGLTDRFMDLPTRQACAAVGQGDLVARYGAAFRTHGIQVGQVLLTRSDFDDRLRYLNLRSTLSTLLRHRIVPVINENDAVATDELAFQDGAPGPVFGDNDGLSCLVATKLSADLLVLLTDVAGVYRRDPARHAEDEPIGAWTPEVDAEIVVANAASGAGRGGMGSKIAAARMAARSGCDAVIASGLDAQALRQVLAGDKVGTHFPAAAGMPARDRWIAIGAPVRGTLHLDAGAIDALRHRGASLLAAGVDRVTGEFDAGDVVALVDCKGAEIGRGIVHCDAGVATAWAAGKRPDGVRNHDALVHRDHLVVLS